MNGFVKFLAGVCVGIALASMFLTLEYKEKYIQLRSEIRSITGVDITYPYSDERKNKAWFGGKNE